MGKRKVRLVKGKEKREHLVIEDLSYRSIESISLWLVLSFPVLSHCGSHAQLHMAH